MAGRRFVASRDSVATGAATQKVGFEVGSPSTHDLRIYHWMVTCQGTVSNATPFLLQLIRATASVSSTGSVNPMPLHRSGQASFPSVATSEYLGTSTYPHSGTAQDTLFNFRVPPTTGFEMWYPEGKELIVFASQFMWWVPTAAADVSLSYVVEWEE